jgi:hypothetical protein
LIYLVHHPAIGTTIQRARVEKVADLFRLTSIAIAVSTGIACSGDASNAAPARGAQRSSAGSIALPSVAYRPITLGSVGTITGTVEVEGEMPGDSIVVPTVDAADCGSAFPDSSIVARGKSLGNVVVWLSDVKEGKVLPVERRTEIVNQDCRLVPRVQAVVAGTTINVRNEDRLAHRTRFVRGGAGGDTVATVPLTDDGQVVPNEHIAAKGGMVTVSCAQHPWTRGFIAVFESPYYAITDESGAFRLDSVPPGKYRLVAWHERGTAQVEREVEISAGGTSQVDVRVRLR